MRDDFQFTVTDVPGFLIGLFANILHLEYRAMRAAVRLEPGVDPDAPVVRDALAERAVDVVLARFPPPARDDLAVNRATFIAMLVDGLGPDGTEPESHLRLVPPEARP